MQADKHILKSADGQLQVDHNEVENACMCVSMYALLQYLLMTDEMTAKKRTAYFLGYAVGEKTAAKLPAVHFATKMGDGRQAAGRWRDKIALRLTSELRYPFLNRCRIYAQDMGILAPLIGNRKYALLSDSPTFLTQDMSRDSKEYLRQQQKGRSVKGWLERLLYGPLAVHNHGDNKQCQEIYLTDPNESPIMEGKIIHVAGLRELWEASSESKRRWIMSVFDLDETDTHALSERPVMFLSQALVADGIITEEEYSALMRRIVDHYGEEQMIVKTHPRDTFDYQKTFPGVKVYRKSVNMQLLTLTGVKIERAVTICSSSINAFPDNVEADWLGAECHPKIEAFYGNTALPLRPFNHIVI